MSDDNWLANLPALSRQNAMATYRGLAEPCTPRNALAECGAFAKMGDLYAAPPPQLTPDQRIAWANTANHRDDLYAYDCDGNFLWRDEAGMMTLHGWDVDHAVPRALYGTDHPSNLRARHWRTNRLAGSALARLLAK